MLNLGKFEFVSLPLRERITYLGSRYWNSWFTCKWSQRHYQRRKL